MSNLADYSQTPASNNGAPPDGAPEGMLPSTVNNTIRQMMANMAGAAKCYTAGGTANVQTVTMDPTLAAYSDKVRIAFIPVGNNTGACTLNVNGLGAVAIKMPDGTDPPAGALNTNMVAVVHHNGTNFRLLNPASFGAVPITSIELGHASDTTITRSSAGIIAVEGVAVVTISAIQTLTNKTLTSPSITSGTITGTINGSPTLTGAWTIEAATPSLNWTENDAAADNQRWRMRATVESFRLSALSDDGSVSTDCMIVDRTGTTVDTVNFAATSLQHGGVAVVTISATQTLTNKTLTSPVIGTSMEFGHATDTTLTRPAAGRVQIEGREVVTAAADATVLTSTITELNKVDDSVAAVSGFVSGIRTYIKEDGGDGTTFDVSANVTENTFESVGPTGSGAVNIWSAMNNITAGARIAIIRCTFYALGNEGGTNILGNVYVRMTGDSTVASNANSINGIQKDNNNLTEAPEDSNTVEVHVPLDSSRRFDITWACINDASVNINLYLVGFIL